MLHSAFIISIFFIFCLNCFFFFFFSFFFAIIISFCLHFIPFSTMLFTTRSLDHEESRINQHDMHYEKACGESNFFPSSCSLSIKILIYFTLFIFSLKKQRNLNWCCVQFTLTLCYIFPFPSCLHFAFVHNSDISKTA